MILSEGAVHAPASLKRRRWTNEEYLRLGEHRIITDDVRIELIAGEIVHLPPVSNREIAGKIKAWSVFAPHGPAVCVVSPGPLRLGQGYEPMPDAVILKPRSDFYASGRKPHDVLLVIEIADSSREYDLNEKARIYAAADIPEYWVSDLVEDALVVHREPTSNGYAAVQTLKRGQKVAPLAFSDWEIAVDDVLP